jgi:hypothetical protein
VVWDLRGALLKKQEAETARLVDFEFRQRVRTMRLLAPLLRVDEAELVRLVAQGTDEHILAELTGRCPVPPAQLAEHYRLCRAQARKQLVRELGDPAPHRLA